MDQTSTPKAIKETRINVLSFDGGGSRGVMEVILLRDVMNFATILMTKPEKLDFPSSMEDRVKLRELLENVKNPIHPTKMFKFIVGTSTGALIAFGLVGGKTTDGGKQQPLTVDEVIEMYKEHTNSIFSKRVKDKHWIPWLMNKAASLVLTIPTEPYSQEGLEKLLEDYFGEITLAGFPRPNGCIAGAVVRQIFEFKPDKMVLFTSGKDNYVRVTDILKASAAAPVYFQTPVEISGDRFIDGGVGGNCPLQQALPKVLEFFDKTAKVDLVVSIAPPKQDSGQIPDSQQWKYWIKWFPNQISEGNIIYHDCKLAHPAISFERLMPKSEEATKFNLDGKNIDGMIKCVKRESTAGYEYFQSIMKTSCKLILRSRPSLSVATLKAIHRILSTIGENHEQSQSFDDAIDCHKWSLETLNILPDKNVETGDCKVKCFANIGSCQRKLGKYSEALDYLEKALILATQLHGVNVADLDIALTLGNIGVCCYELGRYDDAIAYHSKALEMRERLPGGAKAVARSLNNVGVCQQEIGEHHEALRNHTRALEKLQQLPGDEEVLVDIAATFNMIGICKQLLCDYSKAFQYHHQALTIREQLCGNDIHASMAGSLNNIGICHSKLGHTKEALVYFKRALKMKEQLFGEDVAHPSTTNSLNNTGICLKDLGQYHEALIYLKKALKRTHELYGHDVPQQDITISLEYIARCLLNLGHKKEALGYYLKMKQVKQQLNNNGGPRRNTADYFLYEMRFPLRVQSGHKTRFQRIFKVVTAFLRLKR